MSDKIKELEAKLGEKLEENSNYLEVAKIAFELGKLADDGYEFKKFSEVENTVNELDEKRELRDEIRESIQTIIRAYIRRDIGEDGEFGIRKNYRDELELSGFSEETRSKFGLRDDADVDGESAEWGLIHYWANEDIGDGWIYKLMNGVAVLEIEIESENMNGDYIIDNETGFEAGVKIGIDVNKFSVEELKEIKIKAEKEITVTALTMPAKGF